MTQSTTETVTFYLERILQSVHPLMAEGIYLAAVPYWYNQTIFSAIRSREDGRDEGLVERLTRYSFVNRLDVDDQGEQTYAVRSEDRGLIQRHWIIKEPDAYRAAHQRALTYWQNNPDPNPFAQAQSLIYHQLFVDQGAATNRLIDRFRVYANERQLGAIERLLDTVDEARFNLALLNDMTLVGLEDLLTHMWARLAQMRGDWSESLEGLQRLRQKGDLVPELLPYVTRAYGFALAHTGDYVGAITEYETTLTMFKERTIAESDSIVAEDSGTLKAEQAQTMIALGDAHIELAKSVQGPNDHRATQWGRLKPLRDIIIFILSLPLLLYLSRYLGRRVWRPRFWPTLAGLDWIVARLFAAGARYYQRADPILEQYGDPGEGVAADEKLAYLYLAMGDAEQAQSQFEYLLQETEAPLGEYRKAAVRVGLGQARLRRGEPVVACDHLKQALPALKLFEDSGLEAMTRAALAEALFATGEKVEAVDQFNLAAHQFHDQGDLVAATDVLERMESLVAVAEVEEGVRERATAVASKLSQRQYATRYRHPLLIQFQRFILLLLPLVLLLMPLLVIRLATGINLTPIIQFKAAPIFSPSQAVSSELSQGVTTANVVAAPDANVILWLAVALFALYVLGSLILGLLLIIFTPLSTVQAQGRAGTIHLDEQGIRRGGKGEKLNWTAVSELVMGDVRLWERPLPDESAFALTTPADRLIVRANTNWYESLRQRISQSVPPSTQLLDLDTSLLGGKLGRLYLANIVLMGLMALLTWIAPKPLWRDIPGLPYSLTDLYPYLYLGLVVIPTWWIVIRPLRTRMSLDPHGRLLWWALGGGLLLALLQTVTLFRPLLTAVNLYPPLVTLMILAGAGWAIWRVRSAGQPVYPTWQRGGTAVLATIVCLLMALLIWREVGGYHYLVLGNARRDRSQQIKDAEQKEESLSEAINAYNQAIKISGTSILGIDVRAATRIPFGIPEPHSFTWLSALINRAAAQVQLGRYAKAIGSYQIILDYTDQPAEVYAWRAIARQSWNTTDTGEGKLDTVENQYELALADFNRAIKLEPARAVYYLWLAVAHHALDEPEQAWENYEEALARNGQSGDPLTDAQRERAFTGQGWLKYQEDEFAEAEELFESGTQANPKQAEAWVGLGYANYSQAQYDDAGIAWEKAFALDPNDPTVLISLGTLHWKFGGLTEDNTVKCDEYSQSADFFTQATAVPGQDPETLAFTYRTRGQVQSLLRNCPGFDKTAQYLAIIDSYTQAIELDRGNASYHQLRARWTYALWDDDQTPRQEEWLYNALEDITVAYNQGMRDNTTLTFRRAILNALQPQALEKAAKYMAAGDFEAALAEYGLLARSQPEKIDLAFQTGLAALGAGDTEGVKEWYGQGVAAALEAENGVQLLTQALAELDAFVKANPGVNGRQVGALLERALLEAEASDPGTIFAGGLAALEIGQTSEAMALYEQALTAAVEKGYTEPVRTAVLDLITLDANEAESVLDLFQGVLPKLAATAGDEEDVAGAFDLGYIALALNEMETAANWYNEGIRRTVINNQYPVLRATRGQFLRLWSETGVTSTKLLAAMETYLPAQIGAYPELEEDGLYWRFRAWFKYGLGLSAYRLDKETAAANALKSGQEDAVAAYALDSAGNAYVQSYLTEGAWGWYNVVRGDDAYGRGNYDTALEFYELAVQAYIPVENRDARSEAPLAAFKAGLTAVQLSDFLQASAWFKEGVAQAKLYGVPDRVSEARAELLALQTARSEIEAEIDGLLELLPTQGN